MTFLRFGMMLNISQCKENMEVANPYQSMRGSPQYPSIIFELANIREQHKNDFCRALHMCPIRVCLWQTVMCIWCVLQLPESWTVPLIIY